MVSGANTINVGIGTGGCSGVSTTQLAANGSYTGDITVTSGGGQATHLSVSLTVGNGSGGNNGLAANPSQIIFNTTTGGQVAAQNVQVTLNGFATTINSFNFTATSGINFLNTSFSGSTATLSVNNTNLNNGSYSGILTLNTSSGSVNVSVTLNIGTGSGTGVAASPSQLFFSANIGQAVNSQTVSVTVNGSSTSINGFSFTPTTGNVSFINTNISGSIATLSVNNTNLAAGTYTGTETLNTGFGSVNVPITLTIGSGSSSGVAANPTQLFFTANIGQAVNSQNVSVTVNGSATTINGFSFTPTTGNVSFINTNLSGSIATLSVNNTNLAAGTYTGTETLSTGFGSVNVPVTLTIGGGSTSGVAATPAQLFFTANIGGSVNAQNVSVTVNGSATSITGFSFTPTTGNVSFLNTFLSGSIATLSVNNTNLAAGTYTGTETLSTGFGSVNVPVTLTIGGNSTGLVASPTQLFFSANAGQAVNTQNVSVSINGSPTTINGFSFTPTTGGVNFINTTLSGGSTATLAVNNTNLTPGTYTGTETLNTGFGSVNVPVTLTIGSSNGVTATPSSLQFNATSGGSVATQTVSVAVNGQLTAVTSSFFTPDSGGVNFITVNAVQSNATFSVTNTNLSNGTYTGTETLNTGFGPVTVPVTLVIGSSGGSGVTASPTSLQFSAVPGASVPSQNVSVAVNGALTAVTSSFFTPGPAGITFVSVTGSQSTAIFNITNTNLPNGTYTGTETLNTGFGPVTVPVTLVIGSGTPGVTATPNPVNFSVQSGGSAPSQNVAISVSGVQANITNVTAATNTGGSWLSATAAGVTGNVVVSINASGLSNGSYTGTVTVNTLQGTTSFQVNLTVGVTATLLTTPTTLNFAYQTGTNIPTPQTIAISSSGTPINFSVSSFTNSGGNQWLVVSPSGQQLTTPTTLTVSIQPSGLQSGITYTGTIQINTFGGATNSTVNIPVNLLVTNSPILTANPNALSFTAQAGATPPAQSLSLQSSSSSVSYSVSSSVSSPAGFNWLQVANQSGATPANVSVNVVTSGLPVGTYNGTVTITSQNSGNPAVTVPVTLNITAGSTLQLTPSAISFAYQTGFSQPGSQILNVTSPSGTQVPFTASVQTNNGVGWLNITPTSAITPGATVSVTVNTSGLAAGTYNGTIFVTPSGGAAQTVPVTLVVSNTSLFVTSPNGVSFTAQSGGSGATPSFQNVAVTSTDGKAINFGVSVNYTAGASGWLFVNTSTGGTPTNLTISANPFGLQAGTYTATVTLNATSPTNVANSPQTISVTLTVTSNSILSITPASLSFAQSAGGSPPAAQGVTVSSTGAAVGFSAVATTNQGGGWLSVTPSSAVTPASLSISVNGAGLVPGNYSGQVVVSSPGSSNTQTISVNLTVASITTVNVSPASLAPVSYQIGGANPPSQTVTLSLTGAGSAAFSASATTTSGGGWLSVTPSNGSTPGNVVVTVNPAGLPANATPYQGSVTILVQGATNSPIILPISLTVTPQSVAPNVVAIQNNGSFLPTSISPGLIILIYGTNMGPAAITQLHVTNGLVDTNLAGTRVTFDGVQAPIVFTRTDLVSVIVPYEIAGRATSSMTVTYNGVSSTPLQLRVVDTAPAIFTLTQTGSGQGAILNQNGTVNGAGNPELVGNVIQIFGTGEGLTTPTHVTGTVYPATLGLPSPTSPVGVTIGGVPVPASDISYAAEAPGGVAGLIQINAKIPAGVGSGPQPVFFTVAGIPSQQGVTVNVR